MPKFHSEAEEADWYASPAGRSQTRREFAEARKRGVIRLTDRSSKALLKAQAEAQRTGKLLITDGTDIKRTDPAKLQALVDSVKAKAATKVKTTEQIALRLPVADLAAAKRIAARHGIGYQTLLKEIIHDAMKQAS